MSPQIDPIAKLKAAGVDVEKIPESERKVLADLSADEVNTLVKIHERVAAGSEVQGYLAAADGGGRIFW